MARDAVDEQDRGPWEVCRWAPKSKGGEDRIVLQSDDFHHDVALEVTGDFADLESRTRYAQWLAKRLTAACSESDASEESK